MCIFSEVVHFGSDQGEFQDFIGWTIQGLSLITNIVAVSLITWKAW